MHWLLPAVAAAASAAFAAAVLRQYAARRRPYQLAWGIALSMFAAASLALTVGVAAGWTPLTFKLYYLFGAVLNVPWLALGTVELLAGRVQPAGGAAGEQLDGAQGEPGHVQHGAEQVVELERERRRWP